jgi:hypothetical protein
MPLDWRAFREAGVPGTQASRVRRFAGLAADNLAAGNSD